MGYWIGSTYYNDQGQAQAGGPGQQSSYNLAGLPISSLAVLFASGTNQALKNQAWSELNSRSRGNTDQVNQWINAYSQDPQARAGMETWLRGINDPNNPLGNAAMAATGVPQGTPQGPFGNSGVPGFGGASSTGAPGAGTPGTGSGSPGWDNQYDTNYQNQLRQTAMDSQVTNPNGANTWGIQNGTANNLQQAFGGSLGLSPGSSASTPTAASPVTSGGLPTPSPIPTQSPTTPSPVGPSTPPPGTQVTSDPISAFGGAINPATTPAPTPPASSSYNPENSNNSGGGYGDPWPTANRGAVAGFAKGTKRVIGDQIAKIHDGEAIIPASKNPWNKNKRPVPPYFGGALRKW